jgi:hypothetical protein
MGEGVAYSGLHGVYSCTQAVEEVGGGLGDGEIEGWDFSLYSSLLAGVGGGGAGLHAEP